MVDKVKDQTVIKYIAISASYQLIIGCGWILLFPSIIHFMVTSILINLSVDF